MSVNLRRCEADDFLDIHQKNKFANMAGKAAIVRAILEAERASKLFYDRSNANNKLDMGRVEDTLTCH
jgi:hypothetical protein